MSGDVLPTNVREIIAVVLKGHWNGQEHIHVIDTPGGVLITTGADSVLVSVSAARIVPS